jgi:hypothetical protein
MTENESKNKKPQSQPIPVPGGGSELPAELPDYQPPPTSSPPIKSGNSS